MATTVASHMMNASPTRVATDEKAIVKASTIRDTAAVSIGTATFAMGRS
jgi:hypothetical protein